MKIFNGTWVLPLLTIASGLSAAEPGLGTPPQVPDGRCTISVSSPFVDYGVMSRWQLQDRPNGQVTPGIRSTMVNVVCPDPRAIKLLVQGEVNETGHLRYGEHGYTEFRLLNAMLDGNAVELRPQLPDGSPAEATAEALPLAVNQQLVTVSAGQVVKGKMLSARLEIQPVLGEDDVRVSSTQRSGSQLTLTLID